MYVCICNALTHADVAHATTVHGASRPGEVFHACKCRAKCGTCVSVLRELVQQALDATVTPSATPEPAGDAAAPLPAAA
ncbi:(2Fe-2S)-binding protein [Rhodovastum atsumiense]|uniref:Bacterioferritin-associated ferredoxin n=1 Tax=Rhodovastum atsumiense TaxID=504468 RepID=A0A5M6IVQ1_9PROT|nr:(2Fe-2S)-binding protein [Rhodovastum atsumiense]KAA5612301.1 bacterioferritin [Rhodovastum atsumiense]